jgi:ParB-like chromosome segregation protein Spo0J
VSDGVQSILLLEPDPDNAREITPEALEGLGVSMQTFGDLSGIVWNQASGHLVAGHQRMENLRAAGVTTWTRLSPTEGVIVHPDTGERFRVRIVDWDATRERMANLAANNPEIAGTFTPEALDQLKALEGEVAFEALRLGELEAQVAAELAALQPPEDFPPVDEDSETGYRCPKCRYEWNGEPRP